LVVIFLNACGTPTTTSTPATPPSSEQPVSESEPESEGTYTLSIIINPENGGDISQNPTEDSYISGTVVTLTATASLGYRFNSWAGDISSGSLSTTVTMDSDKTIIAQFSAISNISYDLLGITISMEDKFELDDEAEALIEITNLSSVDGKADLIIKLDDETETSYELTLKPDAKESIVATQGDPSLEITDRLKKESERHNRAIVSRSLEENNHHFNEARERLEKWVDDMVLAAEKELKDTKQQIKALSRQARLATVMEEQHQLQEKIREMEKKKRRQRQRIFDLEDEIIEKRDGLIESLEKRMAQRTSREPLFTIRWQVI